MQIYCAIVLFALIGLVPANSQPVDSSDNLEHQLSVLYNTESPALEPEETGNLLAKLADHFTQAGEHGASLSEEEQKDTKLYTLLADLKNLKVYRCNKNFFGGVHALISYFNYRSPSLHAYLSNVRDEQSQQCVKFVDSNFSSYTSELDVAMGLLA